MGNLFTEGLLPSLQKEDPRYFRRGQGRFWGRAGYVLGNSIAEGISNAYYPDGRTAGSNFGKLSFQRGTDALSNILKEFWPDVKRRIPGRPVNQQP